MGQWTWMDWACACHGWIGAGAAIIVGPGWIGTGAGIIEGIIEGLGWIATAAAIIEGLGWTGCNPMFGIGGAGGNAAGAAGAVWIVDLRGSATSAPMGSTLTFGIILPSSSWIAEVTCSAVS